MPSTRGVKQRSRWEALIPHNALCPSSARPKASQCLLHKWLTDLPTETALSKTKLKRYVIKKRWVKAVNTIIALRRMGANITFSDN
uniref:Uncharacterized protein n=1 Tax=Timema genevievae TaxID=629358 RepID=A0A7R9JWE3_TIMGE|nr:unnamed protein product [Timema genevievae]